MPIVLRSTISSPFGRKLRMALLRLGLEDRVTLEPADTLDATDTPRMQNPLGKMPCLLIGKTAIYDSHVMLDLLDSLAGGVLVPQSGLERFQALTRARLADGITEAALLVLCEGRFRAPEQVSRRWLDHRQEKIRRASESFDTDPPDPERCDLVEITLSACLGYLDWREVVDWRARHPKLERWMDRFSAAHSFWNATKGTS